MNGGVAPYNFFFTTANTGFAAGGTIEFTSYTNIKKTINGGNSWSDQISTPNTATLRAICFTNNNTGFAGNASGELYKTTNGGVNWSIYTNTSASQILSIYFCNATTGYLTSVNGSVLKTTNTGDNWTSLTVLGTTDAFYSSAFTSPYIGYIVGAGSTIVQTTDGGASWEVNSSPSLSTLRGVSFPSQMTGYIVGHSGTILKTNTGVITSTEPISTIIPDKFSLSQNYPNPFNPSTIINYQLAINSFVTVKVYDNLGNEVSTLVNEKQNAGSYSVDFNAASLPSGIYFYKLSTENFSETKKMILVK